MVNSNKIKKIINRINYFYKCYIKKDIFYVSHRRWILDHGEQLKRFDYKLGPDDLVLDIGGYKGDFASEIFERFGAKVFIFEPANLFYKGILDRFSGNKKIECLNFGLSDKNEKLLISLNADSTSVFQKLAECDKEYVSLRDFCQVYSEFGMTQISLIKINIEGGEYVLLPYLIDSGLIKYIDNIQIQFHDFIPDAYKKREAIRNMLKKTHEEEWCYPFVWESWKLKV